MRSRTSTILVEADAKFAEVEELGVQYGEAEKLLFAKADELQEAELAVARAQTLYDSGLVEISKIVAPILDQRTDSMEVARAKARVLCMIGLEEELIDELASITWHVPADLAELMMRSRLAADDANAILALIKELRKLGDEAAKAAIPNDLSADGKHPPRVLQLV